MRAVGYFRDAGGAAQTLAEQNKAFLNFCAREGLEVSSTFVDSGNGNGRGAGFLELLEFLRKTGSDAVVVVPSLDALGPQALDALRRYYQLEGLGVQIAAIEGGVDPVAHWTEHEGGGRAGERVRAAMRRKAVKGEVLGRPPYGYKVGNRRRLELVPEEAVVIRYIFRLYLQESMGIRLIARRLNEEGLRTRRGGNWSMVSIRDILRNRAYLGTYARFGVRVPGSHPSLVSNEDFRKVQDRLNARRTSYNPRVTSQFLLSGMAICGYCGNKLIGVSRKQSWKRKNGERVENTYRYYQCESRTNQSVCAYHTRRAGALESDVRAELTVLLEAPADREPPVEDGEFGAAQERERDRLKQRAKSIDKRLQRYADAVARGRMTREHMHELSVQAARDRLAVDRSIEQLERRLGERPTALEREVERQASIEHLVRSWDDMQFAERQALLRSVARRVEVHDDRLRVDLRV